MLKNIWQEFIKLKSQKFFAFIILFFFILCGYTINTSVQIKEIDTESVNLGLIKDENEIEKEYVKNYENELRLSILNLRERTGSPLIRNNDILKNSLLNQANEYENLDKQNLSISYSEKRGLEYIYSTINLDIYLVIVIFVIGILIFNFDRQKNTNSLIASIKNGSHNKAVSKIILYIIVSLLLAILTYSALLLMIKFRIGFGDINRNIQSMSMFRGASINLTVISYIFIFIIQKLLAVGFWVSFSLFFLSIFKDIRLQIISSSIFIIFNYLIYTSIKDYSIFGVIKYFSLFSHFNVFELYGKYSDVFLFLMYIKRYIYSSIIFAVFIILSLFLSYYLLKNEIQDEKNKKTISIFKNIKIKRLSIFENYRLYFNSLGVLFFIVMGIFGYLQIPEFKNEPYDFLRYSYKVSLFEFSGIVNENKMGDLEKKKIYYENLPNELDEINRKYEKKEISLDTRDILIKNNEKEQDKIIGFEKVFKQAKESYLVSNKNENLYLIDEKIGEYHFVKNNNTIIVSIIFYMVLIFVVSEIFIIDESYNMNSIIKSSINGHSKLLKLRIKNSFIFGLICFIFSLIILYADSYILKKNLDVSSLVQSVPQLLNFGLLIDFSRLFFIYFLYGIVNLWLIVNTIVFICQKLKNRFIVYFASILILVSPTIVSIFLESIWGISLNPFSNIHSIIFSIYKVGFYGFILQAVVSFLLGSIIYKLNKKQWTDLN